MNPFTTLAAEVRDDWRDAALCREVNAEMFFGEVAGVSKRALNAQAKAICRMCPVRAECLDYALARREQWGVWGGLTERERRDMRGPFTPRAKRTHCVNGHAIAEVGRDKSGNCRACQRTKHRRRYQRRTALGLTGKSA